MARRTASLLVALSAACRVGEPPSQPGGWTPDPGPASPDTAPQLVAEPPTLDFGPVAVDGVVEPIDPMGSLTEDLTLHNWGDAPLQISAVAISPAGAPFAVGAPSSPVVQPGESAQVAVTFLPAVAGEATADLVVTSDDPAAPAFAVPLLGEGRAPELEVTPTAHDFGATWVGCDRALEVHLTNAGNLPLELTEVGLVEEAAGFSATPQGWSPPHTVAPGDHAAVAVAFAPRTDPASGATLRVASTDPSTPVVQVPLLGDGQAARTATDRFELTADTAADVLFAVDRSCSLDDDIAAFQDEAGLFLSALADHGVDPQVAVAVEDDGCILGPDLFLDSGFSAADAQATLSTMINLGGAYGSNSERQFMLMEAALNEATDPSGCNHGLLRSDATLHLVGFSDEPEQSVHPYTYYVALFQSLKADPADVVVHAIGGDYPAGCTAAAPYTGFYEATVATGGGFYSICTAVWAEDLAAEVAASVGPPAALPLSAWPVVETLTVTVDGAAVEEGWAYDATDNAVVFDPDAAPASGATVEVAYATAGDCGE